MDSRWSDADAEKIVDLDDKQLRHVLFLVRRWMRHSVNEQTKAKGLSPYFG